MINPKEVMSKLTAKQLSECTDSLSETPVKEDAPLRILAGGIFGVEPKDTTVEMFNVVAVLLCKEWNMRYKFLKSWINTGDV
jgi:hypothetical protein